MRRARGWLLDAYIAGSEAVLWIKTEDGKSVRLTDRYRPSFYIELKEDVDLEGLTVALTTHPNIAGIKCEWKYTSLTSEKRKVLRIDVDSTKSYRRVLKDLSEISGIQAFYNIDLPHIQWYLFWKDLPPTGAIDFSYNERNEIICFEILDDWQEIKPPPFTSMIFDIEVSSRKLTPDAKTDPISKIVIFDEYLNPVKSLEGGEERLLSEFSKEIERLDPDFLVSDEVDEKISYILERAEAIGLKLKLGREDADRLGLNRLLPYAHMGRVPLNLETFLSVGVAGIVELSRFSLAPPGLAARWPAGKIIDSRQCYEAVKRGIIIPQSRASSQYVKTARDLVFDDRGSLILSPKTGLHENVGVLDFESMFPNIIVKYNVSYETVSKDGIKAGTIGFLPQITKKYLERRLYFKHLKKSFPEGSCEWMCASRGRRL
ncbi:MAG: 3'-5' exonuclease [Candidatus Bathyarchaeia archaeon]